MAAFLCSVLLVCLVVSTADGPVLGSFKLAESGDKFRSFQGIPFAAPPVDSLRFAPPQPVEPWEDVLDVSADADIECVQYGFMSLVLRIVCT